MCIKYASRTPDPDGRVSVWELVGNRRFAKALYRQALALEGLQQCQNALEAMLAAQKQLPHDVQASTTASASLLKMVSR